MKPRNRRLLAHALHPGERADIESNEYSEHVAPESSWHCE